MWSSCTVAKLLPPVEKEKGKITLLIPSQTRFYVLADLEHLQEPSHHFRATTCPLTARLLSDTSAWNSTRRFLADFIDSGVADSFKVQLSIESTVQLEIFPLPIQLLF